MTDSNIAIVQRNKTVRNSSIELLRILAACAVVVLHYNGMGHAFNSSSGLSHEILMILESLCACAVDLFIMISGYFLCTTLKRTWDKPIYLLLELWVITIILYISRSCFIENTGINAITLAHQIIPPANYFVLLYLTLYIVSPFINLALNTLSEKGRSILVLVLLLLFSLYPTLIDSYQLVMHHEYMGISTVGAWGQQHGYTIVCFSLCYCLGAWLRLNRNRISFPNWLLAVLLVLVILGIYGWFKVETKTVLRDSIRLVDFNSLSYSNPLVLAESLLLLAIFSKKHFSSKFVNILAKASFVCYIFHLGIIPLLGIESFAQDGGVKLFVHLTLTVVAVYFASFVVWFLLDRVLSPIVYKMRNNSIYKMNENEDYR